MFCSHNLLPARLYNQYVLTIVFKVTYEHTKAVSINIDIVNVYCTPNIHVQWVKTLFIVLVCYTDVYIYNLYRHCLPEII